MEKLNKLYKEIGKAYNDGDILKYLQLKKVHDILKYYQKQINYCLLKDEWLKMNKYFVDVNDVPLLPNPLRPYHIDALIRCGAIPKKDLIVGETYYGNCRNATKAIWLGDCFEYIRHKFNDKYPEKINHFEDDNGYDLFVPIEKVNH